MVVKMLRIEFGVAVLWLCLADVPAAERTSATSPEGGLSGMRYVATDGNHVFPYDCWEKAATNIQAAIDTAPLGGRVLVSNGVYTVSTAIMVTNKVTVCGVYGPEATHVSGGNATRVFVLGHQDAVIEGLTIRDGRIEGGGIYENNGGGVWFDPDGSGGTLQNCIVIDNCALTDGGGVYLRGQSEGTWVVRNCLIKDNQAAAWGGGIFVEAYGKIQNCTVVDNAADWGGGIFVDKDPADVTIENTFIWYNFAATDDNNYSFDGDPTVLHSSAPDFGNLGFNNIDDIPPFVDIGAGNYRLDASQTNWPGFHGGVVRSWMINALDLDGNDRLSVVDGTYVVDIGAYQGVSGFETTSKGTPIDWFRKYGIDIDPDRGEKNWDDVDARFNPAKGMTLREEYIADTNPNDPRCIFRIAVVERNQEGTFIAPSIRSDRIYSIEYSADPVSNDWAPLPGYSGMAGIPDRLMITNWFGPETQRFFRITIVVESE